MTFEELRDIATDQQGPREHFVPATLRERRRRAGVSPTLAAAVLGVREKAWLNWESGQRTPRNLMLQHVERILAALNDAPTAA